MTKKVLINRTVETLEKLPLNKVDKISEFAEFILKKHEEQILQKGMETLMSNSKSFDFLHDEEDLYEESDLIEKY